MSDIFLSYAREDKARVEPFVRLFEKQGWSVWWDPKIAVGASFADAVEKALAEACCVVVIWTATSVTRDWVRNEAREGAHRKVFAPVLLDRVPIPLEFRGVEAAILSEWDGISPHVELDLLLRSIAGTLQRPITDPTLQPSLWQRVQVWLRCHRVAASTGVVSLLAAAAVLFASFWLRTPYGALQKIEGDGQTVSQSHDRGYRMFFVKVVDRSGSPVSGAKVVWQTPYCGNRVYVGETDGRGVTGATNMCSPLTRGAHQQIALLVDRDTRIGFWDDIRQVPRVGHPVAFSFQFTE